MAQTIDIASVVVPVGVSAFEVDSPTRANGAIVTISRFNWPVGPLFTWRVFERERNGVLKLLSFADESGGVVVPRRDGQPGEQPLVVQLRWASDADRDRIRFEVDAIQVFTCGVRVVWVV